MLLGLATKLVMVGDSITDAGRTFPRADGSGLGSGYVTMVNDLLAVGYPERRIRVVNAGISGNTVRDLDRRWQPDVLDQEPDWVSVMIGINDVWRQFDRPKHPEEHVGPEEYEATLARLVERTLPSVEGMVLLTPFFIESHRSDEMRVRMDTYGAIVRGIARANGTVFVDTQAAFDRLLEHDHPTGIAWDRVHPGGAGHLAIAHAFLDAIGYRWPSAT